MLYYKIDILAELKKAGYPTTRLRKEKIINESAIQYIRDNKMIGFKILDTICEILNKQPGDIIGYKKIHEK